MKSWYQKYALILKIYKHEKQTFLIISYNSSAVYNMSETENVNTFH